MQTQSPLPDAAALESLLAFWRDAGVDACFEDAPVDRTLAPPKPEPRAEERAAPALTLVRAPVEGFDPAEVASAAARAAAGAETIEALAEAIAGFNALPMRAQARRAVFGRGAASPALIVVGQAPSGDDEDAGEPFRGRAGAFTERMLAAAGLLDRAYFLNTVFWRPAGDREPTAQEQAACLPFLERAFYLLKPQVLLLSGAGPVRTLLKSEQSIMTSRGKWFEWRAEEGGLAIPAIPVFGSQMLLSQPEAKKKAWFDLLTVREKLSGQG